MTTPPIPLPVSDTTARVYARLPQLYRDADAVGAGLAIPVNLLSYNQSSFLTDASGWSGWNDDTTGLARAGTPIPPGGIAGPVGRDGTNSLAVTQLGSGVGSVGALNARTAAEPGSGAPLSARPGQPGVAPTTDPTFPMVPGQSLTLFGSAQPSGLAPPKSFTLVLYCYDSAGNLIANPQLALVNEIAGAWVDLSGTLTVPDGAAWGSLGANWDVVPFGETHYVSRAGVFAGTWASWPGGADNSYPLLRYLSCLLDQAGEIEKLLNRFLLPPGGTCDLTDPLTADAGWLSWLAQLVGVHLTVPPGDPSTARDAVRYASGGWQAGTSSAIANAAKSILTGTKYCAVFDHYGGDMWQLEVRTRGPETPLGSPDPVVAAILAKNAKPAGVALVHTTWAAAWATLEAAYPTWANWDATGSWQVIEDTGGPIGGPLTGIVMRDQPSYSTTGAS